MQSILISSPGRCGTHWLARILRKVYGFEQQKTRRWNEPEMLGIAENVPEGKLYISHDPPAYFIPAIYNGLKCIEMVRDFRDMVVSAAYYWAAKAPEDRAKLRVYWESGLSDDAEFDEILDVLKEDMHNWRWFDCRVEMGNCVVRYEDLHANPKMVLARLRLGEGGNVERAIRQSAFDLVSVRDSTMYRRGIVGEWKEHFTALENEVFLVRYGGMMRRFGYAV